MKVGLMVVGAFVLTLGIALIVAGPTIVLSAFDSSALYYTVPSASIQVAQADLVLLVLGIILAPIGAAALVYGIGSPEKSSPSP